MFKDFFYGFVVVFSIVGLLTSLMALAKLILGIDPLLFLVVLTFSVSIGMICVGVGTIIRPR